MISRHWSCIIKEEKRDEYLAFLRNEVLSHATSLPGYASNEVLERKTEQGIQVLVITRWQDLASVKAFAGDDISVAMVPEEAQQMMISFDKTVTHYEVIS